MGYRTRNRDGVKWSEIYYAIEGCGMNGVPPPQPPSHLDVEILNPRSWIEALTQMGIGPLVNSLG